MTDDYRNSTQGRTGKHKARPLQFARVDHIAITEEDLAFFDQRVPGIADYIRGLAEKAQQEARNARTDALTLLPNRLGLEEEIGHIMRDMMGMDKRDPDKARACSLVFIDTNDFGLINKAMGDSAGDLAIQTVGEYFDKTMRHGDLVARKGGDEFVIAMRCPKEDAEKRLQELKKDFNRKATQIFRRKLVALIKSQHDGISPQETKALVREKLDEFQKKLAAKHQNPALENAPFSLSFSFGVREISKDELASINLRTQSDVTHALSAMMGSADELMRNDKDAYRTQMAEYSGNVRQPAERSRLLRGLGPDGQTLS